jgi:surfactin synthase thioesterase subunit
MIATPRWDPSAGPWLRIRANTLRARTRLICLPYGGGNAQIYRTWPDALPPEVEVCAVCLPGRMERFHEPGIRRVDALVSPLLEAVTALPPVERTVVYGHSFGALVAFELTRALARRRSAPSELIVGGRCPPHLPSRLPPIHQLPDRAFIAEMHRRYGGSATALLENEDLLAIAMPALRADFEALETYRYVPDAVLSVPITALRGTSERFTRDEAHAWAELTSGRCDVFEVDAGHFFVDSHPAWVLDHVRRAVLAY